MRARASIELPCRQCLLHLLKPDTPSIAQPNTFRKRCQPFDAKNAGEKTMRGLRRRVPVLEQTTLFLFGARKQRVLARVKHSALWQLRCGRKGVGGNVHCSPPNITSSKNSNFPTPVVIRNHPPLLPLVLDSSRGFLGTCRTETTAFFTGIVLLASTTSKRVEALRLESVEWWRWWDRATT